MTDGTLTNDRSTPAGVRPEPTWLPRAFVWGVWAASALAALLFVARYGRSLPYFDDYTALPYVTGEAHDTAAWLWAPHNEHRIPLPKLVLLGLLKLARYDWRAGMYFNVLGMAVLSYGLIRVAQRLRGSASYLDAVFPLLLLHLGHCENFLWSWQVGYTVPLLLVGGLLMVIASRGTALTPGTALLAGACLALLPLCGANALALVPALALWLGYAGLSYLRSPQTGARRVGIILLAGAGIAVLLGAVYLVGLERGGPRPARAPGQVVATAARFLTLGYGRAATLFREILGPGLVALLLLSAAVLARAWWRQPAERLRAVGLLLFMGALACLALGTGWARPTVPSRYALLAAPLWCGVYFVWELYGPPAVRRLVQAGLVLLAVCLVSLNVQQGLEFGNARARALDAFQEDLRAGVPAPALIGRHTESLYPGGSPEEVAALLRMMGRAGIVSLTPSQEEIRLTEAALPQGAVSWTNVSWKEGWGHASAAGAQGTIALPEPRFVSALRITFCYAQTARGEGTLAEVNAWWRKSDGNAFPQEGHAAQLLYGNPGPRTVTVYVGATIDRICVQPESGPCVFQLTDLALLTPGEAGAGTPYP